MRSAHPLLPGRFILLLALSLMLVGTIPALGQGQSSSPPPRKIVLLAGKKSHGPVGNGEHDYGWSVRLLKVMFDHSSVSQKVNVVYHLDGWPEDEHVFDDADTIVVISDGRDGDKFSDALHIENDARVAFVSKLIQRGCGLVTFHFSTFSPQKYARKVLDWNGGYYQWETNGKKQWYSNLKVLDADVKLENRGHPILRGVSPWHMREEFYFDLRFEPDKFPITPLLTVPSAPAAHPDGHIVAWARQRPDGGRGFGTTCGHYYAIWQQPDFRKMMLNAIAWTAHVDIPAQGIDAPYFTHEQILAMLKTQPVK